MRPRLSGVGVLDPIVRTPELHAPAIVLYGFLYRIIVLGQSHQLEPDGMSDRSSKDNRHTLRNHYYPRFSARKPK